MKRLFLILLFASSLIAANAQSHRMKYYFEEEYECWSLEDSTSYRTNMPVIQPDGTPGNPSTALVVNESGDLDLTIVKNMMTPVLSRYKAQGMKEFIISYIVLPNGRVDEVSFSFYGYNGKPNITQEDMFLWRALSDTLKEQMRHSIPPGVQRLQFYVIGCTADFSRMDIPFAQKSNDPVFVVFTSKPERAPVGVISVGEIYNPQIDRSATRMYVIVDEIKDYYCPFVHYNLKEDPDDPVTTKPLTFLNSIQYIDWDAISPTLTKEQAEAKFFEIELHSKIYFIDRRTIQNSTIELVPVKIPKSNY